MVVVNPGTGPVENASEANAIACMEQFITDLEVPATFTRDAALDSNGRFGFQLASDPEAFSIEMPGLALGQVRYTGEGDQCAWHFPRLYVEGSSWLWIFAISIVREHIVIARTKAATCPTCNGSGEVTEAHESYAVETLGCPHCGGSGKRGQS